MNNIKHVLLLFLVLAVAGSTDVSKTKRDTLLKLEKIEQPAVQLPRNNASERTSQVTDDRRGSPDVLLQILGLKDRSTTTTRRPYYPTPPPWHPPKPTHKPPPPPYPHYPYPPYPYYPHYPHYPYWPYPPYPHPHPHPHPPYPWPTPSPTPAPTPTPTPVPMCVRPIEGENPNGELAPPSGPNCPPPPPPMNDGIRQYGEEAYPVDYQLRASAIKEDDDDDENGSSESILRVHKKKLRLHRFPAKRPHIIRINTDDSAKPKNAPK